MSITLDIWCRPTLFGMFTATLHKDEGELTSKNNNRPRRHNQSRRSRCTFLASRDKYVRGAKCHSPTVRVGVRVGGVNKNFNLGHNFQTRSDRPSILHMCIPCDKTFHVVPYFFFLETLTLKFDLLLKNFNLGHNFQTRSDMVFILHMCIPCDKTSQMVPLFLTLTSDLLLKNFNLDCDLVMVAARRASLSSDNSYLYFCLPTCYFFQAKLTLRY